MNSNQQAVSAAQAIQIALKYQQAGQLQQAEKIYRSVLSVEPNNADALHLLGTLANQAGKHQEAVQLIENALRSEPSNHFYLNNLGNALKNLGRLQEAELKYRQALALRPDYAHTYYNLAGTLEQLGRTEEAEKSYRQALSLAPKLAEAHYNLGNMLQRLGRFSEAVQSYQQALALRTRYPEAHNNLGSALKALGRLNEAERNYRQALHLKPDHAYAYCNLGAALHELGRLNEAEQSYRSGLALKPDYAEAYFNLGNVLRELGSFEEAEQSYRQAINLKPQHAEAHYNHGLVLKSLGKVSEAESSYQQALALKPSLSEAYSLWVHESQHSCEWSTLEQDVETLRRRVRNREPSKTLPFPFLSMPGTSASEQYDCARQFAEAEFGQLLSGPPICNTELQRDKAKIRIGYLSGDYYAHATSHLLPEVIEQHSRARYDVYAYSYGPDDNSATQQRMRAAFDVFRDIRALPHEEAAQQIARDKVDILVDLKGYTPKARLQITALRPAPIQVSWLGYPGTLGHSRLADYLIGDPIVTPLGHARFYSEHLALMPHCYQPNDSKRIIGALPTRRQAGLPDRGFVFCSFNASYKLTPAVLDLWCRLLKEVSKSVLWLLQPHPGARENLLREVKARGIKPERVIFAPKLPIDEHLGRFQLADLALDTYPYTSHTTASDALWAGVPLVTLIGETFASRVASSILHAAGLPQLVTGDPDSYFELALRLAGQPQQLKAIKMRLAANRATCPLFDSSGFVRDLERLYERMWLNYKSARKESIVLSPTETKTARASKMKAKTAPRGGLPKVQARRSGVSKRQR